MLAFFRGCAAECCPRAGAGECATYHQIVGDEPGKLKAASPLARLLPSSLDAAIAIASAEHPAILATEHLVDAAAFSVKSQEGALLPQLSANAGVSSAYRNTVPGAFSSQDGTTNSASIGASLSIPIYSAGAPRRWCASPRNRSARRGSRSMSAAIQCARP